MCVHTCVCAYVRLHTCVCAYGSCICNVSQHFTCTLSLCYSASGVYGHEDYHMALPLLLVHLPSGPVIQKRSLYHTLPVELQAVLSKNVSVPVCITVYVQCGKGSL